MTTTTEQVQNWIQDGTPTAEPVTVETPAADATPAPAADLAPAAEAAPSAEPAVEERFFVGRLNGEEFKVPETFEIPVKRGDEVEWIPIVETQKRTMMHKDYSIKTAEVSAQRREIERSQRDLAAQQARMKAQEEYLEAERQQLLEARSDADKYQAFLEHLEMMRTNPYYRQNVENGLRGQQATAELDALKSLDQQQAAQDAASLAMQWIEDVGKDARFTSVDPERVRALYANALVTGQLDRLDRADVEALFAQEAQTFQQQLARSPLMQELESVKAQLAALSQAREADTRNKQTQHAMARAKAPNIAPVGAPAAPAAPSGQHTRFGINQLPDKVSEWVRGG